MSVSRNWMLLGRGLRNSKVLRNREENKDDIVKLDFSMNPSCLMNEILSNICKKHGISNVRKLNYLNAFVHLMLKNPDWESLDTFGFTFEEIASCLRIALIQDSVQVRAAGLRALRYIVRNKENVVCLNKLHFPYLIARCLDLLLKSDNERVLMSERIQALKMMRHIMSIAPEYFSPILVRPLVSVVLRPLEETDRLLKACIAVLCELGLLNSTLFIESDGVRALLRNILLIPSSHIVEAICGTLLFLLNKPSIRELAKIDLHILISGYTNCMATENNSFREEERRLTWTNFALLTMLRSCSGIFELCSNARNGLKSIVQTLYLNKTNTRKAILELLYDLMNIPQFECTNDENFALEMFEISTFKESFNLNEGFITSEAEYILPSLTTNRVNLIEVHTALILVCLLEAELPDILVEVIVSSETSISLSAAILLGEFINLTHKLLPLEYYDVTPALPNLISYAVRGCPLQLPSFAMTSNNLSEKMFSNDKKNYHTLNNDLQNILHLDKNAIGSLQFDSKSTKSILKSSYFNLNLSDDDLTMSSQNYIKDRTKASTKICNQNLTEVASTLGDTEANTMAEENISSSKCNPNSFFYGASFDYLKSDGSITENRIDLPPCKEKQRMASLALGVLSRLQEKFMKPLQPVSLLLNSILQYGDGKRNLDVKTDELNNDKYLKKKTNKISLKELEELIKETGVLIVPEPNRWKWDIIRILLRLSMNNLKILMDANFKTVLKKLVYFFKPSSKKYSHTPLKSEFVRINIYTLVACDLLDVLLDSKLNDVSKLLTELLEDIDIQLKQLIDSKSVHDCLLSPLRLTNSLSQDYFLLVGRLSNSDSGLIMLEKFDILQKLQYIVTNINLDCYVKLIISSLSYTLSDSTRKLLTSALSCNFASTRLYATKYLLVLLRSGTKKSENYRQFVIEMLVNQLYDENRSIAMIALSILNEAADNRDCLDFLISLRPSLLHLGDTGLLLLIRFLSTEKGFAYLQVANFVSSQLQRWASSFNVKYMQIVEGELHDALSQYQRGDDGLYRKRLSGCKAKLKNVIVPPHLYGQLVQHAPGFELLLKQDNISSMMQMIIAGNCESDKSVIELKAALWAIGHFATSSVGVKYLHGYGVIKAIVSLANNCNVYTVKMTSLYVLSMIATSKEGVAILNNTNWRCLKRSRHSNYYVEENSLISTTYDNLIECDDNKMVLSPINSDLNCNDSKKEESLGNDNLMLKLINKFKSATLPQRSGFSSHVQHNRSFSESKADTSDECISSASLSSNFQSYISEVNERLSTLSPIPSTSSLTTGIVNSFQKENRRSFSSKCYSNIGFGARLNSQNTIGYRTLRMLHNRQFSDSPHFSASATIEYLSAPERRQMSPLIRPKFPCYPLKSSILEFDVRGTPQIDDKESFNISCPNESSQFSHSTEIDGDQIEFDGPCYLGICLPLKIDYFLPVESHTDKLLISRKLRFPSQKVDDEPDFSGESDSERLKCDDDNHLLRIENRRRRHDKSACLLCSAKPKPVREKNFVRSRRTSTSSIHRNRTETESSYGGGIGLENDSPILLTWQQKPAGLVDNTLGAASFSTLENGDSQNTSVISSNENSMKSRSILRKEVLKLIEQLGNPVLYRTCKQGLLQLKQICRDLFQDICLFSDISLMLGSINYKIQARQLIQDLFLDAPFHELYEEVNVILNGTLAPQETEDTKLTIANIPGADSSSTLQSELNPSQGVNPATFLNNNSLNVVDSKAPSANSNLEVIIETCTKSEALKNERDSAPKCEDDVENTSCRRELAKRSYCDVSPQLHPADTQNECILVPKRDKDLYSYNCRQAYSYPTTNYITTDFGIHDESKVDQNYPAKNKTIRSRSVSATCSYLSELNTGQKCLVPEKHHVDEFRYKSLILDEQHKRFSTFSKS